MKSSGRRPIVAIIAGLSIAMAVVLPVQAQIDAQGKFRATVEACVAKAIARDAGIRDIDTWSSSCQNEAVDACTFDILNDADPANNHTVFATCHEIALKVWTDTNQYLTRRLIDSWRQCPFSEEMKDDTIASIERTDRAFRDFADASCSYEASQWGVAGMPDAARIKSMTCPVQLGAAHAGVLVSWLWKQEQCNGTIKK